MNMDCLTWTIGDITITRLVESASTGSLGGPDSLLPEAHPHVLKTIDWLIPDFVNEEGHARLSLHALIVQTPTYRLIVDTWVGNDKERVMPVFKKYADTPTLVIGTHFGGPTSDFLNELDGGFQFRARSETTMR
jgi:hypothetical protein